MHRALVHTSQSSVHLLSEAQLVSQYRRNYICIFYPLSYLDQLPRIGHCSLLSDLIHYCSFGVGGGAAQAQTVADIIHIRILHSCNRAQEEVMGRASVDFGVYVEGPLQYGA